MSIISNYGPEQSGPPAVTQEVLQALWDVANAAQTLSDAQTKDLYPAEVWEHLEKALQRLHELWPRRGYWPGPKTYAVYEDKGEYLTRIGDIAVVSLDEAQELIKATWPWTENLKVVLLAYEEGV